MWLPIVAFGRDVRKFVNGLNRDLDPIRPGHFLIEKPD
jgi:hypothetical protein